MNHHKWLHSEIEKWTEQGIVDKTTAQTLKSRYPIQSIEITGLLMFFAALLIGIGGIFFIAHNWNVLSDWTKLSIIFIGMLGAYGVGELVRNKGKVAIGLSLIFLGTLIFGAGIFLIGQMFHIVAYNAVALLAWSIATASIAWIYRNPYIMMAGVIEWGLATWFQFEGYGQNPFPFLLVAILFFYVSYLWKSSRILFITMLGLLFSVISSFGYFDLSEMWVYPISFLICSMSLLFYQSSFSSMFYIPFVFSLYVTTLIQITLFRENWLHIESSFAVYAVMVLLFGMIALLMRQKKLLFLWPFFLIFLPTAPWSFVALINAALALIISVYMISLGERKRDRIWINYGTILFLLSVLFLYILNVWSFLDSSLFFIVGGIFLFVLAVFMERRRRKLLSEIREVK